ncbi:MAG TPA: ATP-binding protein [Bacillota bacterium]|nr:ATP-binding protein [Bacillota bacterium]
MSFIPWLYFIWFIIYAYMAVYVLHKNPKSLINRTCAALISCFAVWNFMDAFSHTSSIPRNLRMIIQNISSLGWAGFPSVLLCFALAFSKKDRAFKSKLFTVIWVFIPLLFIYQQWTGSLTIEDMGRSPEWGYPWAETIWAYLFYVYYIFYTFLSSYFIYRYRRQTTKTNEQKQAKIIVVSIMISFLVGTVTDVIIPNLYTENIPELSNLTSIFFAAGMVYAIIKYGFLTISPEYAAGDIISTMKDSLILIDPDGKIAEVNNATLNLLGYRKDEIIGKQAEILFSEELTPFKLTEGLVKDYQFTYLTKKHEIIPVSFSCSVLRDKENKLIGIVGIARDMREMLRLQERERELSVEEARTEALQERAQELQEAYDRLKTTQAQLIQSDKLAVVGQLAGGVAHEINNPIGVILGFAQSIAKRIPEDDPLYMPLKSIEREAIRCKNLVGNLLTFSRSGKTPTEMIDISQTLNETLSLIEAQTKVKNIEIIRMYEPGLPQITVNKNQLQQVIINLCNNAIDAIDSIGDMPENGKITIGAKKAEAEIVIEISDTGSGMTEELKKHIFEPFFTTKEVGKGTGLGLSLCYEIIRKHQGIIEVESEAGNGSTFRIKLPIT